jgi:hypothetical protein
MNQDFDLFENPSPKASLVKKHHFSFPLASAAASGRKPDAQRCLFSVLTGALCLVLGFSLVPTEALAEGAAPADVRVLSYCFQVSGTQVTAWSSHELVPASSLRLLGPNYLPAAGGVGHSGCLSQVESGSDGVSSFESLADVQPARQAHGAILARQITGDALAWSEEEGLEVFIPTNIIHTAMHEAAPMRGYRMVPVIPSAFCTLAAAPLELGRVVLSMVPQLALSTGDAFFITPNA